MLGVSDNDSNKYLLPAALVFPLICLLYFLLISVYLSPGRSDSLSIRACNQPHGVWYKAENLDIISSILSIFINYSYPRKGVLQS